MLCGYNTNGLQNHRLHDALRLLADHGFAAVALTLDVQHLDPFTVTSREIEAAGALCSKLGLTPVIETGARFVLDPARKHEPTLMTRGLAARAPRLDFYARCAAIGRDVGAASMSFWSGVDRSPDADSEAWMLDGIALACAATRSAGLVPCLEPEPGMAVDTVARYADVVTALGVDAPRLTLDIGHVYVNEEEPAVELIARHAEQLEQVQLEDMKRGVHDHLLPGEGDVDFVADLSALQGIGFRKTVCFELSRSSHMAPDALRTCRRLWDDLV